MTDIVDQATRSRMMSSIQGRNTTPEIKLRKALFKRGFRYRLHGKLPGKPDLVLPKYQAVIFVHGCFWHRHKGCKYTTMPKTRREFWERKFDDNVKRDLRSERQLLDAGWRVATVWECSIREQLDSVCDSVGTWLSGTEHTVELFPST